MTPEETTADRLIKMGYLKYVPISDHPNLREQMIQCLKKGYLDTSWDDAGPKDRRIYNADGESLAEGGIGGQLLRMRPTLQAEGVQIHEVEDVTDGIFYDVAINGNLYPIYNLSNNDNCLTWGISLKRYLEIVNDLLQSVNSNERLYGIYGGNEGMAILLTPEMYDLLKSPDVSIDKRWMPFPPSAVDADGRMIE